MDTGAKDKDWRDSQKNTVTKGPITKWQSKLEPGEANLLLKKDTSLLSDTIANIPGWGAERLAIDTAYKNKQAQLEQLLAMLAGSGGSGGSGRPGRTYSEQLAQDKFDFEKEKYANELAQAQAKSSNAADVLSGWQNYYDSGKWKTGIDAMLANIAEDEKTGKRNIDDRYKLVSDEISEGYNTAKELGSQGYSALTDYLRNNPNNPYAGRTASSGVQADAMSQFLNAYGVSAQPVLAQVAADQLQAQQGAANYQNLLNTLSSLATQGDASRKAEAEMAQLLFNTGLGSDKARFQAQAEMSKVNALQQLAAQMTNARREQEAAKSAAEQSIVQTILNLGGNATPSGSSGLKPDSSGLKPEDFAIPEDFSKLLFGDNYAKSTGFF